VQANVGKIELHVNLIELLSQQQSKYTEEQIKIFDVLQKKAEQGFKDVDAFIKARIVQQLPITVTIVVGKNAIVDGDIKHSLKEAIGFYDFRFERINLSSEMEIINALRRYSNDSGILVISRGGGENLEVFNKLSLAEEAIKLKCPFLTAIGHKQDTPLLQKVADKAFITPTELGQYFNQIYNHTIEELQNSKAKLIDDIAKQFENSYQEKLKSLGDQLEGNKQLNEKQIQLVNDQMNEYKNRLAKKQSMNIILWILVIVACVVGIIIGKFVVFRF